ncbi:MAG: LysR family transcriptional regulator [Alicyclobacillus sp.]|nr:LysR family transcriptional regulator [Alicyclobacillus sp.]
MDTRDVALFLAIARIGSITRAAEQLFLSQSTVTARLQRLERTLGYPVFIRTPTGVQLTPQGQRLIPLAERMAALEERMLQSEPESAPILRVLSGRAFVSVDVPACLARVVRQLAVHLKVRMGLYDDMLHALLANQVDLCFFGEPIYHPHVCLVEFPADSIDLIVPADHPWADQFPGLPALAKEPLIAFGRANAPFRKRVLRLLARSGVYPAIRMELDSIDGIKAMVSHGLGVSFLPRRTLHDAAYKGIAVIPFDDPAWQRPTFVAYPEAVRDRPLVQQVLDIISEYYQELAHATDCSAAPPENGSAPADDAASSCALKPPTLRRTPGAPPGHL